MPTTFALSARDTFHWSGTKVFYEKPFSTSCKILRIEANQKNIFAKATSYGINFA